MKKCYSIFTVIFTFCFIISSFSLKSVKLFIPRMFGMIKVSKFIYVDPELSDSEIEKIKLQYDSARTLNLEFYGELETKPVIIVCSTAEYDKKFGIKAKGRAHGQRILIGSTGIKTEIIAHEWSHCELHKKIPFFEWKKFVGSKKKMIPWWFDEGLAVYVSKDPRYYQAHWRYKYVHFGIDIPDFDEIKNRDLGEMVENNIPVYAIVYEEVERWLNITGYEGLEELIKRTREGEDFETAYKKLERD